MLGLVWMVMNVRSSEIHANILAVPLFLAVTVPLLWRRGAPIAALAATLLALLAHAALFPDLIRCGVVLPTVFLLVFAAATGLDLRMSLIALGLALATIVAASLTDLVLDVSVVPPF
ncbi:MAG: hypothetical protein M3071_15720, partial [Actinomycetota bacterium]|nr:hypothetical protein [Actinomycetota bacterium]